MLSDEKNFLTPEELRRLFDAVYERDMAALRAQQEHLKELTRLASENYDRIFRPSSYRPSDVRDA